jgi:cysteine desulfurase
VVGAEPGEVVFTSGGTEADNLAVSGVAEASGGRVLCSAVEHHAVLAPVQARGGDLLEVGADGRIDLAALERELSADRSVGLVSVMTVNNEVGTIQPIAEIVDLVVHLSPATAVHTDAVAAAPWLDLAHHAGPAHLVSVSGHKVGGPQGIGALVVRHGTPLAPALLGGGQERERRAGTPNVAGAVGFAAALAATARDRVATVARVERLRQRVEVGLSAAASDVVIVSPADPELRTPGTVLACFPGLDREVLVFLLDQVGVAASWGSSCSSGAPEPSHVLTAMGAPPALARGALRLSLGWCSSEADVDALLAVLPDVVTRARGAAPGAGHEAAMVR